MAIMPIMLTTDTSSRITITRSGMCIVPPLLTLDQRLKLHGAGTATHGGAAQGLQACRLDGLVAVHAEPGQGRIHRLKAGGNARGAFGLGLERQIAVVLFAVLRAVDVIGHWSPPVRSCPACQHWRGLRWPRPAAPGMPVSAAARPARTRPGGRRHGGSCAAAV